MVVRVCVLCVSLLRGEFSYSANGGHAAPGEGESESQEGKKRGTGKFMFMKDTKDGNEEMESRED